MADVLADGRNTLTEVIVPTEMPGIDVAPGDQQLAADATQVVLMQALMKLLDAPKGVGKLGVDAARREALEALLEKEAHPVTRTVLSRLLAGLREGKRFSSVLAESVVVMTCSGTSGARHSSAPASWRRHLHRRQRRRLHHRAVALPQRD